MLVFCCTIFLLLLSLEYAYILVAKKMRIVDIPHHQSSHRGVVVRGGGIIFYLGYLLWSLMYNFAYYEALIGLSVLAVISFIDDVRSVSPKIRLICHFIAIIFMFYHTGLIRAPFHVIVILSVACVGAMNIYNFMDGINGMTGGYSLVVTIALLYVNEYVINFFPSQLLIIVIIALLVFNFFNYRKQAMCFAGDVGSLTLGFLLVYLVLRLALKGQSMSWIAMLSVYIVDGGMTILHRIILRENLMKPHKKHAYQIMANELKLPHMIVSGLYMILQAICSAVYIYWPGYPSFFAILGFLIVLYFIFMKKYYHLHEKNF